MKQKTTRGEEVFVIDISKIICVLTTALEKVDADSFDGQEAEVERENNHKDARTTAESDRTMFSGRSPLTHGRVIFRTATEGAVVRTNALYISDEKQFLPGFKPRLRKPRTLHPKQLPAMRRKTLLRQQKSHYVSDALSLRSGSSLSKQHQSFDCAKGRK